MKRFTAVVLSAVMMLALFAGCGKSKDPGTAEGKNPAVADIYDSVAKAIGEENLPNLAEGTAQTLSDFYGIKEDEVAEFAFYMPMMNVQADEIFIAKAAKDKMSAIEAGIEKRKIDLDTTWKQYLPDVYETVKGAQVVKNGEYIMYVVSEHADKAVEAFNTATK